MHFRRPIGHDDRQAQRTVPRLSKLAPDVSQQIHGGRIRPVKIVEKQHQWTLTRQFLKECRHLALHSLLRERPFGFGFAGLARRVAIPGWGKKLHRSRRGSAAVLSQQALERFQERQIGFGPGKSFGTPAASDQPAISAVQSLEKLFD